MFIFAFWELVVHFVGCTIWNKRLGCMMDIVKREQTHDLYTRTSPFVVLVSVDRCTYHNVALIHNYTVKPH